jgi:RHS repeat-associated protein
MLSMRTSSFFIAVLALLFSRSAWSAVPQPGSVGPQTLRLPDGPGSIQGLADSPTVGAFSGQVRHSIAFDVPSGPSDFKPALSLDYDGALGAGISGIGWRLRAPVIQRSLDRGVPSYTEADELVIRGMDNDGRLVRAPDGTWRIEGDPTRYRITQSDGGFIVRAPEGETYRFGTSDAARQGVQGRVSDWYVEEIIDAAGQRIRFEYERDNNQIYLAKVIWGTRAVFRLSVELEERPDAVVSYRAGYRTETRKRVRSVTVWAHGEELRRYNLAYDVALPLSRLAQVTMTGRRGVGALPALRFGYGQVDSARTLPLETGGWALNVRYVSLLDVDGDGLQDLVRFDPELHTYRRNRGNGTFAEPVRLRESEGLPLENAQLMDVDGDGRPELVRVISNTWRVRRLAGNAWEPSVVWRGSLNVPLRSEDVVLADLNGDGRTDVVKFETTGLGVHFGGESRLAASVRRPPVATADPYLTPRTHDMRVYDANGDGLADFVWFADDWFKVYLGRGDGTFEDQGRYAYPWPDRGVLSQDIHLADLNRDGLMDIVRVAAASVQWYAGQTRFRFDREPTTIRRPDGATYDAVVSFADLNGNGSEDIVWSTPVGMWSLDVAGSQTRAMLTSVDNGLGRVLRFEYVSSAQLARDAEGAGRPWTRHLPTPIPVVSRTLTTTGDDSPARVVTYAMRDGFWDAQEREFVGFLTATQQIGATGVVRLETDFEPGVGDRRVLRGLPIASRTLAPDGTLILSDSHERDAIVVPGFESNPLLRRAILRRTVQRHFEGVERPIETVVEFEHDAEGRVVVERNLGRTDRVGDETVSLQSYASDDAFWVRDRVVSKEVRDGAGNVLRRSRNLYGDASQVLPEGVIGAGWLRRVESLLRDASRGDVWTDDEELEYDALGNVIARFDGNVWSRLTFDEFGTHPIEERLEGRSGAKETLRWRAEWDRVLGKPARVIGPNGDDLSISYDALGREIARAYGRESPFVHYVYDWVAPRPRTTTYTYQGRGAPPPWTGWREGSGWREVVEVSAGDGEALYTATRLSASTFIVDDWTERDFAGRVVFRGEPFEVSVAPSLVTRPSMLAGMRFEYDALGRTIEHTSTTGGKKRTRHSAFSVTTEIDGLAPVRTDLDGLGRITRTERIVNGIRETVDADYDSAGAITRLSLQGGSVEHLYEYDTLGRLVQTRDPESGIRGFEYDDLDRMTAQRNALGETVRYDYDELSRVSRIVTADGRAFIYHYDRTKEGTTAGRTLGRVAWIEEPTGEVAFAYDEAGNVVVKRRRVGSRSLEERTEHARGGGVLSVSYDDGFAYAITRDDAGRPIRTGPYWEATKLDARGAILEERFGNGVVTAYERNEAGEPLRVRIERASRSPLYDVTVLRNAVGAIVSAQDGDGRGLDHTAAFTYDLAGRLTGATLGAGSRAYSLSYTYDGLQNITSRKVTGPREVGVFQGTYVHGGPGRSPRQLARIESASGNVSIDYDAAGRLTRQSDFELVYNAFDELVEVLRQSGGSVTSVTRHGYGYDGQRTWTRHADGTEQIWFQDDVTDREGEREHSIAVDGRTVAKVRLPFGALGAPAAGPLVGESAALGDGGEASQLGASLRTVFGGLLSAAALALMVAFGRPSRRRVSFAMAGLAVLSFAVACSAPSGDGGQRERVELAWATAAVEYFHQGFSAGPVLFTGADGAVIEERRYEPFGAPIEAYREQDGVGVIGDVDHRREPRNALNKDTDPDTGFSYHGARWLAPQLARWLTPDPPTKAPDPKFLLSPWDLHPYAYVRGNPLAYWDPDGEDWKSFARGFVVGAAKAAATAAVMSAVAVAAPAVATAVGVGMAAYGAYQLYQNRHEIIGMVQRVKSGTTTDADHEAVGEMLGGIVGGKVGARVGTKLGNSIKPAPMAPRAPSAATLKPAPAPVAKPAAPAAPAPKAPAGGCSGGKCGGAKCFIAGTLVATAMGLTPIEAVAAGDLVLARSDETGEVAWRAVEETFVRKADALEEVALVGGDGRTETLTTTPEHPFWVEGRGWISASGLVPGDTTVTPAGDALRVAWTAERSAETPVYNFRVADFHSYFVGEASVWVHNSDCGGQGPGRSFPNRELPVDKHGVPIPDVNAPHTQLGRSRAKFGAEPQAREWQVGANGKLQPTRDIDFSDHGTPHIHPSPHQHALVPNNPKLAPKGGFIRGPAEALPDAPRSP